LKQLYPVQRTHVDVIKAALSKHRAALDSSMTGTGKTLAAIVAARELGMPIFVVCPKAVIPAWEREMKEQGVKGVVINYEKLKTGKRFGRWDKKKWVWDIPPNTLIVWDECHKCKSATSQNCKMLVASKEYHNLMLSATVASNPTELRGVGYLLGLFELPKFWNWCRAHGCKTNPWGAFEFDRRKTGALLQIHQQIYPDRGHRMTISDMADHFCDNLIVDDPMDFGDEGEIAKIYAEMDAELAALKTEMSDDSTNPAAQALVAQLRSRQAVELCKIPLMVEMVGDILAEGGSAAVFVNFDATMDALCDRLGTACTIRGGQTPGDREQAIADFQSGVSKIIVCNIEAGGVGVSLHDTTGENPRTALISPNFNEKSLIQVLGRIHRAGGKSPCLQRLLVATGTIEEKIAKSVKIKVKSQDLLNGAENSLSQFESRVYYPTTKPVTYPNTEIPTVPDHSSRAHAEHSPSALKMFEVCPGYKTREGTNWAADRGTRIHEALDSGDFSQLKDEDEQAIAIKCLDYVERISASKQNTGVKLLSSDNEIKFDIDLGGGEATFGTCDLCMLFSDNTAIMVDYKTGFGGIDDADINCQAWAYTIGGFQKFPEVESIDFYFLLPVRDEVSFASFTRDRLPEMQLRLQTIIKRAKAGEIFNPQPGICDYCGNQARCPALAQKALLIANRYSEGFKLPKNTAAAGEIDNPEDLAALLKLAPIMESWAEGVKSAALDKALNEGWSLPGYRLTERKTPRSITSALQAYEAVKDTVSITDFLAACSKVSVPDLESFYSEGLPRGRKGRGKQELVDKLTDAGVLRQEGVIHVLKAEKA
jgi:hypothetical protein